MLSDWDLLALPSTFIDVPPLLANFHPGPAGYTILLTDLTRIWSETLDRRDVIRRAFQEDTSIDPSEDSHQFQILLDKVRGALSGHGGSIFELRHLEDRKLVLRVSSPLPAPLRQLQWSLFLSPADPTLLTTELVVPLLEGYAQQARRVESLLAHLKDKDHVIIKLVDKLDSSGVDVSTVFLNAASLKTGKKALSWDLAGKAVKGLRPFNEQEWRHGLESSQRLGMNVDGFLRALFTSPSLQSALGQESGKKAEVNQEWWKGLHQKFVPAGDNTSTAATTNETTRGPATTTKSPDIDRDATGDSDEEFQRQATPPPLRDGKGENVSILPESFGHVPMATNSKDSELDAETTDEDGDGLTPSPSEPASDLRPTERRPRQGPLLAANDKDMRTDVSKLRSPKKLGTIGGKKKHNLAERETEFDRELQMSARAKAADIGSEAERQPDKQQNLESIEKAPPQSMSTSPPSAAHRLGRIGGGKMSRDSKTLDEPVKAGSAREREQSQNVADGEQNRPESEGTLRPGYIKSPPRADRQLTRRPEEQLPAAPSEDSHDAADQRRAELKRRLELKSVAPAKKKTRKF